MLSAFFSKESTLLMPEPTVGVVHSHPTSPRLNIDILDRDSNGDEDIDCGLVTSRSLVGDYQHWEGTSCHVSEDHNRLFDHKSQS